MEVTQRWSVSVFTRLLCVQASVNKRVVDLSDELARKIEDCLRQQEEISSLLAQIVDLQARCKGVRKRLHAVHQRTLYEWHSETLLTVFSLSPVAQPRERGAEPAPECLPWESAKSSIRGKTSTIPLTKYTRLETISGPFTCFWISKITPK